MYNNFFLTPLNLICKIRYFKNYFADIAYLSILSPPVTKIETYYNFGWGKNPCKNANTYFEQNMFIIEIIKVDSLDFITYELLFVFKIKKKTHKSSIKELTILITNVFIY